MSDTSKPSSVHNAAAASLSPTSHAGPQLQISRRMSSRSSNRRSRSSITARRSCTAVSSTPFPLVVLAADDSTERRRDGAGCRAAERGARLRVHGSGRHALGRRRSGARHGPYRCHDPLRLHVRSLPRSRPRRVPGRHTLDHRPEQSRLATVGGRSEWCPRRCAERHGRRATSATEPSTTRSPTSSLTSPDWRRSMTSPSRWPTPGESVSPSAGPTRRLRPARHGRCAAVEGRADVLPWWPARVSTAGRTGCVPATDLAGVPPLPVRGWGARSRATRCSRLPMWASRSPIASSMTTHSRRRSGCARPRTAVVFRRGRTALRRPVPYPRAARAGSLSPLERGRPLNLEGHVTCASG